MNYTLPENTLLKLSEFISSNLALYFPKERWNDLERNIVSASKEFGFKNVEEFIQEIISSPLKHEHMEILASNLTINETYFWREPQTFEALEQKIIPELISKQKYGGKRLRIWSAGCSTGEEPYSIAIALKRSIPDIDDWNISILATDISPRILCKAAKGEYGQWSFRSVPEWLKEKYFFQNENKKLEIIPEIKSMVKFEYQNLAEDVYPSSLNNTNAMDIIYCRNVLMYFTQDRFRKVANGLYNSLVDGGYLIVSASELSMQNFPQFLSINVPGMVLYKKTSTKNKNRLNYTLEELSPGPVFTPLTSAPNLTLELMKIQPIEAEMEILKAEAIPYKPDPILEETLNLYSQGDYTDVIDKLQKDDQTSDERILLIKAYANQGKLLDAIESCKSAIAVDKTDPRLHYLYATILQENNELNEAVLSLKRAIFLDSNFVLSHYSLGKIYERIGNIKNANKCYANVLTILDQCSKDEILFESEGLTAGRFKEIITASNQTRVL